MDRMAELTEIFSRKIVEMEEKRKEIAGILRQINENASFDDFLERKIFHQVVPDSLNASVVGVDGGIIKTNLHGMDLMLMRSVAVHFQYSNSKLVSTDYFPSSIPTPEPRIIFEPFSDLEFEVNSNIERQIMEIETATNSIEKFKPEIILLDGSVVPHYTDRPGKSSLLFSSYERMIETYNRLFEVANSNGCILAGVIEDSRGTRFCDLINEKIISQMSSAVPNLKILIQNTRDTNLLTYALKYSERTFVFPYSSQASAHPVLKEFGDWSNKVFTFYLKTAEFDRPVRIDFLSDDPIADADKISSALLSMTAHGSYGFPSVLIEADQRARLSSTDMQTFFSDIFSRSGNLSSLLEQRRSRRPF